MGNKKKNQRRRKSPRKRKRQRRMSQKRNQKKQRSQRRKRPKRKSKRMKRRKKRIMRLIINPKHLPQNLLMNRPKLIQKQERKRRIVSSYKRHRHFIDFVMILDEISITFSVVCFFLIIFQDLLFYFRFSPSFSEE